MLKLTYVELKKPQKLSDGTTTSSVVGDKCGPMYLDGYVVHIGPDAFPLSSIERFRLETIEKDPVVCPECSEEFQDARAVGAHRWFRHKVKGERQK